jgi:hypothetical protein
MRGELDLAVRGQLDLVVPCYGSPVVVRLKHLDHHGRVMVALHPPKVRRQQPSLPFYGLNSAASW